MKSFILGLALVTVACAQYTQYSQPSQSVNDDLSSSIEYLAPAQQEETVLTEQSISSVPSFQDLSSGYVEPTTSYLAPVEQEQTELADDGYRYKTVRRLRHRQRRDVNELSSAEYLPPQQELSTEYAEQTIIAPESHQEISSSYEEPTTSYLAPVEQEQTVLADDGYRYKTVRRLRLRQRRDVNELASAEYLPADQEIAIDYVEPTTSYLAPVEQEQTELADDGYRYKTVRRLRHRQRRDVNELSSAEYLPPQQELSTEYAEQTIIAPESHQEISSSYEEPTTSYLAPVEQEQTVLADDGYRYKTVRRLRHRQRRDVSELDSADYLPPHQELSTEYAEEPTTSYLAPAQQEETVLADDGYRYKTVRRFKVYRH